jgi:hypothetical protein
MPETTLQVPASATPMGGTVTTETASPAQNAPGSSTTDTSTNKDGGIDVGAWDKLVEREGGKPDAEPEAKADKPASKAADKPKPAEAKKPESKKPEEKPKLEDKAETKPEDKPVEKKVGAPGEQNWQAGPKQLRERKEQLEKELGESTQTINDLKTKIADWEKRGKDTEGLLAQLDAERKEKEAILAENRMLKQESSPEFKEKYDKPFERQVAFAQNNLVGLTKQDGSPFTWEKDFVSMYSMPPAAAHAAAEEMLGPKQAQIVMNEIRDLKKLDFERSAALRAEKEQYAEKTKADQAKSAEVKAREQQQQATQRKALEEAWTKVNQDLEASEDYKTDPGDKEIIAARNKDLAIFDKPSKNIEEKIVKDAHIRQRVGSWVVQRILIGRLQQQLAELKEQLEDKEPLPPNGGRHAGGDRVKPEDEPFETAALKIR